jgi:penicillin-binding protein 1A
VTDPLGKVLSQYTPIELDERSRAIEPRNAFVMSQLLQEVTRSGTAFRAQQVLKRNDIYGKTGTTNDSMDAWFAGYHPTLTAVTWIGYDTPRKLGDRETGGGLSLPVWISYMQSALKNTPVTPLPVPAGVVSEGGDWFFQEFTHTTGVTHLGIEGHDASGESGAEAEKKKILDMFKE